MISDEETIVVGRGAICFGVWVCPLAPRPRLYSTAARSTEVFARAVERALIMADVGFVLSVAALRSTTPIIMSLNAALARARFGAGCC